MCCHSWYSIAIPFLTGHTNTFHDIFFRNVKLVPGFVKESRGSNTHDTTDEDRLVIFEKGANLNYYH